MKKKIKISSNSYEKFNDQLILFTSFLSRKGEESSFSNLIEFWDLIPKYVGTKTKLDGSFTGNKIIVRNTIIKGKNVEVTIKPALIQDAKGKEAFYYPSNNEDLLEQILRKIFLMQNHGFQNKDYSLVRVSKRMIRKEFSKLGKKRSNLEVTSYINILNSSHLEVKVDGIIKHSGPILTSNIEVENDQNLNDNMNYIQLPMILTAAINRLEFDQYKYTTNTMGFVSRWLIRSFSYKWKNASIAGSYNDYNIKYTDFIESGLFGNNKQANQRKIINALNEIKKFGYINGDFIIEKVSENGNIVDIVYTLSATIKLVSEIKANNKRKKLLNEKN